MSKFHKNKIDLEQSDIKFLQEAIRLSVENASKNSGGPFGAVIAKNGTIISKATNSVTSQNDPTAHAEILAIRKASKKLNNFNLSDCVLYTSCEPCPMCLSAIYWARINTVFYANTQKDAAKIKFDDNFIYKELALPPGKRKIKMIRLLRNDALSAFRKWNKNPNKIRY